MDHTQDHPATAGQQTGVLPPKSGAGEGAGEGGPSFPGAALSMLSGADGLPPVASILDVLEMRLIQIHKHGHTPESDALLPLDHFTRELEDRARAIHETERFGQGSAVIQRRRAVKLAAMALAFIERLDAEAAP